MPPPRFQFSLAALLMTVAAVAVALAMMIYGASAIAMLISVGVMLVLMALITIQLFYGRDDIRPFCIGAAFPLVMAFFYISSVVGQLLDDIAFMLGYGRQLDVVDFTDPITVSSVIATAILASIVLGYLCVGFRWLIERREV